MAGDTATELKIGNKMPDGSIYAGISPDIGGAMYATPQRIEFNPGVTSVDDPEVMEKYDAVVKHIRELGLQVQINLEYARIGNRNTDMEVQRFRHFAVPAVKACARFAARYQPGLSGARA